MSTKIGQTGKRVAQNVTELRGGLSYAELSRRLNDIGRPIPVLGLHRIEREERRVDADDLVALSVVLEVTPNRLLLPATVRRRAGQEPVVVAAVHDLAERLALYLAKPDDDRLHDSVSSGLKALTALVEDTLAHPPTAVLGSVAAPPQPGSPTGY